MRVRYSRPAARELKDILDFLADRSPEGAVRVSHRIREVERHIARYPKAGLATQDPTLRAVLVLPYPYVLLYEESGDEILVHRIRHTSRQPAW